MKLLLVDDHPVIRAGLRRLLQPQGDFEIAEAADSREALAFFRADRPDVTVIDLNLPGGSGFDLLRRLRREAADVRVLIFSMHAEPLYATQAIEAGARGYLSKIAPSAEILDAIRRVAAGDVYIQHQLAQDLALRRVTRRDAPDALPSLNARELELLRLVGAGRSLGEMAEIIGVSYKTIANSLSLLKSRLGIATTTELVRMAIKTGVSP